MQIFGGGIGRASIYDYNERMGAIADFKAQQIKMQAVVDNPNADPSEKQCNLEGLETAKKCLPLFEEQGAALAGALGITAGDYGKTFTYEEYQARYHPKSKKDDPNDLTAIVAKMLQAKGEASAKGSHINTSA